MNIPTLQNRRMQRLLASSLLLVYLACGSGSKETEPKKIDHESGAAGVVSVETAVAVRQPLVVTRSYSGSLEGEVQANIVAKISERVTAIHAHIGDGAQANQVIISLDKNGTSSQYYQAEAGFKNAEKTLERMKSLYAEGAVSLQTLDGAQTAFDVARANFGAARSAVELTTPIPGVMTALNVNIGDLATPGAVLATIARISQLKIIFNVSETDVVHLSLGQQVQIFSETNPAAKAEGHIVQLSRSADTRSRSFEIKAQFPNTADLWFKPGMYCKVAVQISPRLQALVVPNASIKSDGVSSQVYLVSNGRAVQRTVRLGISDEHYTEILQGLNERDVVVTTGMTNLRDSSLVNIVTAKH
jgi:membrane fusion protein, multidrug efflux system